jgi:hypothetical protein
MYDSEEILKMLEKQPWGKPSFAALKPTGESISQWCCWRRMLEFKGAEGTGIKDICLISIILFRVQLY